MDWTTPFFALAFIALLGVLFAGGRASVSKDRFEINTQGFLYWIVKANKGKGQATDKRPELPPIAKLPLASILWVDDQALNNLYERLAFANLGMFCDAYTSNAEALSALMIGKYDLIISDIGRNHQEETGWDLLSRVSKQWPELPVIFYSVNVTPELEAMAQRRGAAGMVESPRELTELVVRELGAKRANINS